MLDRRAHGAEGGGMIAEGDPRKLRDESSRTRWCARSSTAKFWPRQPPDAGTGCVSARRIAILAGIGLLIGLIVFLTGDRLSEGKKFETYFRKSVQGLEVGAPVKYRGVTIGRVTDIGLVSAVYGKDEPLDVQRATYRLVFVRFVINPSRVGRLPDTETAVRSGLRARVASQGITGVSYIELDFVNPQAYPPQAVPWKPEAEYIPSMPSTLTQVQDAAQQLLAQINKIDLVAFAQSVTGLVDDLRHDLKGGDTHEMLTRATELVETLQQTVQNADLPGLTADLRQTSGAVRDVVQGREVKSLLANLSTAADRFAAAANKLPALLAGLEATSRRAGNSTADIQQSLIPMLRDLQAAAANCAIQRRRSAKIPHRSCSAARHPGSAPGDNAAWRAARGALACRGMRVVGAALYRTPAMAPDRAPAHNAAATIARAGLLVRTIRAGPGLEARGLQILQPDGSVKVDFYEEWAVPPAQAVEDGLRQWLAATGLFGAVLAPGSRLPADLVLEGDLSAFWAVLAPMKARASLSIVLLDQRPNPIKVVLQRTFTAERPLASADAPAIAAGLKAALADVFTQIEAALMPVSV